MSHDEERRQRRGYGTARPPVDHDYWKAQLALTRERIRVKAGMISRIVARHVRVSTKNIAATLPREILHRSMRIQRGRSRNKDRLDAALASPRSRLGRVRAA